MDKQWILKHTQKLLVVVGEKKDAGFLATHDIKIPWINFPMECC
jgi:hypothetical protein